MFHIFTCSVVKSGDLKLTVTALTMTLTFVLGGDSGDQENACQPARCTQSV